MHDDVKCTECTWKENIIPKNLYFLSSKARRQIIISSDKNLEKLHRKELIMNTNGDILLKLKKSITKFRVLEDDITVYMELENVDMIDMYKLDNELVKNIIIEIQGIDKLLSSLTDEIRTEFEESNFDFDKFDWCVSKIIHDNSEIENYLDIVSELYTNLDDPIKYMLYWYRILNQYAKQEE